MAQGENAWCQELYPEFEFDPWNTMEGEENQFLLLFLISTGASLHVDTHTQKHK